MNKKEGIRFNKALAWTYALKDTIGLSIAGMPVRLVELFLAISGVLGIASNRIKTIKKKESILILFLLANFIHSTLVSLINFNQIALRFFLKYQIRNGFILFVLLFFLVGHKTVSDRTFENLCRAILVVNFVLLICLYGFGLSFVDLNCIRNVYLDKIQINYIMGIAIPRFSGSASEAGYLGPFIAMPLYYYLNSFINKRKYMFELIICSGMCFLTFSAFVYLMYGGIFAAVMLAKLDRQRVIYLLLFLSLLILFSGIVFNNNKLYEFCDIYFFSKIRSVLHPGNVFEYSGSDRIMNYQYCLDLFMNQTVMGKILGIGTGGYAWYVAKNAAMYSYAEEAYNIYLSTLLDRGIVGVIILVTLLLSTTAFWKKKDVISTSLYVGIIAQCFHWFISGNFWVYYFWIEIIYFIGYYYWTDSIKNRV